MRLYQDQPSGTIAQLRQLRRDATDAEKALRRALREAFPTLKWRFQAPLGPYRVDFLCFAQRLVIEVDGGQHDEQRQYDERRTRYIENEGFRVIRFWNNDVLDNTSGVIEAAAISLSHWEREGAQAKLGKGEGDTRKEKGERSDEHSPSPRAAARLAPLPQGEGM